MSKAGRLGPAPPAGNWKGTHPHLPGYHPSSPPVQSIPKPWVADDLKANHHLNAQQKWMEKFSPTHGSFKIRSTEGKMLGESLHQIWNISNQDAGTLPQHRNSRTAEYVVGPIVRAVGCLSEHDWNTRTDVQQNIQPHNIDQAKKIQTSTFKIDGKFDIQYINSELNIKICPGASSSKTCPK